jgi:hypothetical protein
MNAKECQQNKFSSKCHFRRANYFVSMQVREFKNSIRLIRKM